MTNPPAPEMPERARICAEMVQNMAVKMPLIFADKDALTAWFLAIMKHEANHTDKLREALVIARAFLEGKKHESALEVINAALGDWE